MSQIDNRLRDRLTPFITRQILYERAGNLQAVQPEIQMRDRRIAGPEIIEPDRDAEVAELFQDAVSVVRLVDGCRLGDLEAEAGGVANGIIRPPPGPCLFEF